MKWVLTVAVIVTAVVTAYAATVLAKRLGLTGLQAEVLRRVTVGMSSVAAGFMLLGVAIASRGDSRGTVLLFASILIAFGARDALWPIIRPGKDESGAGTVPKE